MPSLSRIGWAVSVLAENSTGHRHLEHFWCIWKIYTCREYKESIKKCWPRTKLRPALPPRGLQHISRPVGAREIEALQLSEQRKQLSPAPVTTSRVAWAGGMASRSSPSNPPSAGVPAEVQLPWAVLKLVALVVAQIAQVLALQDLQ